MKVYVKKEDRNAMIPGIIVTIIFLAVSVGIFIAFFKSKKSFVDALASFGTELIFAIIFFGFSMYFIYALFKWPKGYKAKLVNKGIETYNDRQITYMEFNTEKEREQLEDFVPSDYRCYTIGENNLIVGNDYSLKIKEFNWEPKFVEEINSSYGNSQNKVASKVPNMTMSPVFFSVELIFSGLIILCILGIIMYPQYTSTYIIFGTFCGVALFRTFKGSKAWKVDNNINQNEKDLNLDLEKIKPIDNNQVKVGNIVIKYLIILLLVFPIIWFIIMLKMNISKDSFMIVFLMILFVELPIIVMILYNIGYDEKLIRRHKVNIFENINVDSIKYFNIFRPTKNAIFPQYFIVDQNKNLIFKIKKSNFIGTKFVICNFHNIKIGEIKSKLFSLTNEFVINIINEKPFIIRSRMQLHSNYQVIGRDYYVKGDTNLIRNIIYDNKENDIAYISAVSRRNNWYELGNTEVILNDNLNNSVDIIIIALCITMGNFQTFDRRIDR